MPNANVNCVCVGVDVAACVSVSVSISICACVGVLRLAPCVFISFNVPLVLLPAPFWLCFALCSFSFNTRTDLAASGYIRLRRLFSKISLKHLIIQSERIPNLSSILA